MKTDSSKPTLLIDGDHALYVATSAVEREVRWDEGGNHVLYSNYDEAMYLFEARIAGLRRHLGADKVYLAFTGQENFRYTLFPEYKGNRSSRKPLCYFRCLSSIFADTRYVAKMIPSLEADDLLGIWSTQGKIKHPIIVSEDKDLQTIPGRLYRDNNLLTITEEHADYFWMTQTLTGDTTDGYPGLPGCGPKTAEQFLTNEAGGKNLWERVVTAYTKKSLTADDALLMARLSRILRASDWDTKKQEVKLWTPPALTDG